MKIIQTDLDVKLKKYDFACLNLFSLNQYYVTVLSFSIS